MADSKKYDGSQWEHSLRKLTTATADIEPTIYTDGTAITSYTIKGNTTQSGTPTPSNPVDVNGVGERTANLFDVNGTYSLKSDSITITNNSITATLGGSGTDRIYYTQTYTAGTYKISFNVQRCEGRLYSDKEFTGSTYNSYYGGYYRTITGTQTITFAEEFTIGVILTGAGGNNAVISNIMFQTSTSTASYEPYGYKIPISSGGVTTPMYLTEPLLKIGDYEDTLNSDGTVTRRIGKIDLGTRTYSKTSSGNFYFSSALSNVRIITNNEAGNGLCTHFVEVTPQTYASTPYSFCTCINAHATACFNGTGFEDYTTEQFKEAMQGVIMYYVLATPTTETVTAPSIPTTEGANSITVDTTVQPSEFTATWTGWHDSSVKEYDGSQWQ